MVVRSTIVAFRKAASAGSRAHRRPASGFAAVVGEGVALRGGEALAEAEGDAGADWSVGEAEGPLLGDGETPSVQALSATTRPATMSAGLDPLVDVNRGQRAVAMRWPLLCRIRISSRRAVPRARGA
jgi:hypothetical protein